MKQGKVVIIGTGFVGMSYAYALVNQGTVGELVLIDRTFEKAEGEAMDLSHGLAFGPRKMDIYAGSYDDCADAELIVITAGVNQQPGETRIQLFQRNKEIMESITKQIMASGFDGIILVASNPVDLMAYVVQQASGLPTSRVFGSGTSLDTARLRYEIAKRVKIDSRNVHAYIMGEHGDTEFVCWSKAFIGSKPLADVIETMDEINFEDLKDIAHDVKNAAYEIIRRKRATYYGVGMALVKITEAVLGNEHRILPISALNTGEYDCDHVYIGVPAVVNKNGVDHIVKLKLNELETEQLQASSKHLKDQLVEAGYKL